MNFNAEDKKTSDRYAQLAKLCGLAGNARALSAAMVRLRNSLGIPEKLDTPMTEFKEAIPSLATAALADLCMAKNPRKVSMADAEGLLRELVG